MAHKVPMRVLGWLLRAVVAVIAVVVLLDTFGGWVFDGPLGPIPGGALVEGTVDPDPHPEWSNLEEVIELEIRPEQPWSLSVWNVVIDGELYVPSALAARRRWPAVALENPLVRLRTRGRIFERRIVKVEDAELCRRIGAAVAKRYGFDPPANPEEDTTWYFHLAARG
jgi:hypothetical protein